MFCEDKEDVTSLITSIVSLSLQFVLLDVSMISNTYCTNMQMSYAHIPAICRILNIEKGINR